MSRHSNSESPGFLSNLVRSVITSLLTLVIVLAIIAGGVWLATNQGTEVEDNSWLVLDPMALTSRPLSLPTPTSTVY